MQKMPCLNFRRAVSDSEQSEHHRLSDSLPANVTFEMHRTIGRDDLWVNEYTIRYNGERPHKVVGIMEFRNGHVVRERIYINEPWEPPSWRAPWVERIND